MNDQTSSDEFDPRLEALFRREHAHLPAEPFSTATLRAIAAERQRISLLKRLVQAAAMIALIVLSPRLIEASVWLSSRLDDVFAAASAWLASPVGVVVGVTLGALVGIATKRARIW